MKAAEQIAEYDMRKGLTPERVTNAMWDFSWLFCHYPGGSFENFDKVTDELLDRYFNAVRIDCFPWIIGNMENPHGAVKVDGNRVLSWGQTDIDRSHVILDELVKFVSIAKRKGLYLILSSWGGFGISEYPHANTTEGQNNTLIKGWELILEALKQNNLLDTVLYVDLDQEFPFFSPVHKALKALGDGKKDTSPGGSEMEQAGKRGAYRHLRFNDAQMNFLSEHFTNTLGHFQQLYPELRFTYSFTDYWEEYRALKNKSFDVLQLHFWMNNPRFDRRTGFGELEKDRGEHDYSDYMRRVGATMKAIRPMLMQEMHNRLKFAKVWSEESAAPVVTTEAWGPWWHMDHRDLSWGWLRDWCSECMQLAADYGLWGATPWNFCHPYWSNWTDVDWYREVNGAFLGR